MFIPYWQQEWSDEQTDLEDEQEHAETQEPPQPPLLVLEPEEPPKQFIRFNCRCGQRVKIPGKYAGLTGKCPKCSARLQIPAE